MIKQLVIIFSLLISLLIFSSCSIFDSGESEEGETENYYSEEEEGEETGDLVSDEEPTDEGDEESEMAQEDDMNNMAMDEEVQYIDEEDADFLEEEQGEAIVVEEEPSEEEELVSGAPEESDDVAYNEGGESSSFFSSPRASKTSPPSRPAVKKTISYKKIKSVPYNSAGFLINAVYIVRPGEDIQSVSNKIFNSDQVAQLYAVNPHLKARDLKVGDKIYYQSPNRPQDSSQLLFYFEDNGIPASYYEVPAGESIRKVAENLLGHSNSWKEIWATNPDLNSKWLVNQSINIKYWPKGAQAQAQAPPSPPDEAPSSDEPPPPPPEEESPPLEEPLAEENPPAPPSEDPAFPQGPDSPEETKNPEGGKGFSQMDMMLAGILALGAVLCAFMIIKKRKKKKEFDYTATNFEIDE